MTCKIQFTDIPTRLIEFSEKYKPTIVFEDNCLSTSDWPINIPEIIDFDLTAATNSGSIGYVKNSFGSITSSPLSNYIQEFFILNDELHLTLNLSYSSAILTDNKKLFVDDDEYPGYFNLGETTASYELDNPEEFPVLVNGQTYTIEFK